MLTKRWLKPAVWGFYMAVVLEFLFMISPFAIHFYSGYGSALNGLLKWPATAWLTQFFLPHFSITTSPILNALKPLGFALAGIGLIGFLVGAIQVYGSKLLRRGAVTGGLYRWVRHPQYLCLAILGFGVTLIWPRFLVLVSYVAMMFLYYALARFEERDCVRKFGEAYIEYQRKTGLIFPRLARRDGAIGLPQGAGASRTFALYTMTTLVAVGVGFGLRSLSLSRVASAFDEDVAILSPAVIESSDLRHAYRLASGDPHGSVLTSSESKLLVYVVPGDWFLPDLPIHTEAEIREVGGGHATPAAATRVYRVLIARPRLHDRTASGKDVVLKAYGLEPLGIARVDLAAGAVVRWDETPEHVIWGDIPTPLF